MSNKLIALKDLDDLLCKYQVKDLEDLENRFKSVSDLEEKLAESEKRCNSAFNSGHSFRLTETDIQLNILKKEITAKEKAIKKLKQQLAQYEKFMKDNEWDSIEEMQETLNKCEKKYYDIQKQLAEKETRIAELEDKDWYEACIKQLEEQNGRLIEERDNYKLQLADKDEQLNSAQVGEEFALKCCKEAEEQLEKQAKIHYGHLKEVVSKANQDKISFAVEQLEKVKNFVIRQLFITTKDCGELDEAEAKGCNELREETIKEIDNQIEELKKDMK